MATTGTDKTLYLNIEAGGSHWGLTFSRGDKWKPLWREIAAWNREAFARELRRARAAFGLGQARVLCCYEAGRDGFSIHRWLVNELHLENLVVDSASIKVDRRRLQEKSDKLDGRELVTMLARYDGGQKDLWRVVRVPEEDAEDVRRLPRERERLKKEQAAHHARLLSLLRLQGMPYKVDAQFCEKVKQMKLPEHLRREVVREAQRLALVREQLQEVQSEERQLIKAVAAEAAKSRPAEISPAEPKTAAMARMLSTLAGVGATSAWVLSSEFFGWRKFRNRREVASCAGLAPVRRKSDQIDKFYGISKAGNVRVRKVMVELAWGWLRHQPDSALTQWFERKFAGGSKKVRKIGIVAVARRLLVSLWQFVESGVVPDGACDKAA